MDIGNCKNLSRMCQHHKLIGGGLGYACYALYTISPQIIIIQPTKQKKPAGGKNSSQIDKSSDSAVTLLQYLIYSKKI